ncbi:MAG: endolytic transglycosylase MltG, partial [Bacteroidota bacterium]|nr:endolytic transglycosylase MltG [Bacteroidota bacterium]
YRYPGLPPGPVNNPGAASIRAAIYPESHDFYYFVADGQGGHRFSRTIEEHNRAVAAYRRLRR